MKHARVTDRETLMKAHKILLHIQFILDIHFLNCRCLVSPAAVQTFLRTPKSSACSRKCSQLCTLGSTKCSPNVSTSFRLLSWTERLCPARPAPSLHLHHISYTRTPHLSARERANTWTLASANNLKHS